MRRIISAAFLVGLASFGFGQEIEQCASHTYIDVLDSLYPGIKQHVDARYMESAKVAKSKTLSKIVPLDTVYTIPVVFHVLYNNASENVADEHILNNLQVLNEAFNRENADTINTRPIFVPVAGNARIRFKLATEDPSGNATNGIVRTFTTRNTFYISNSTQTIGQDAMKFSSSNGSDAWDTDRYLNVWICDLRNGTSPELLGYAFPPVGAQFWDNTNYSKARQGVVVHYQMIGIDNPQAWPRDALTQEKTLVHEVGHYLGLRHTWGDGFASQGCFFDDFIDDTPVTRTRSSGCRTNQNTCTGDNLPDQIENYMDYSSAECTNMFTKQQVALMRYNLENLRPDVPEREYVLPPKPDIENTTFFPNPFANQLSIFINELDEEDEYSVALYDLHGRLVFEQDLNQVYINTLSMLGLAQGMYYAVLTSEKHGIILEDKIVKIGK